TASWCELAMSIPFATVARTAMKPRRTTAQPRAMAHARLFWSRTPARMSSCRVSSVGLTAAPSASGRTIASVFPTSVRLGGQVAGLPAFGTGGALVRPGDAGRGPVPVEAAGQRRHRLTGDLTQVHPLRIETDRVDQ